MTTEQLDHSFDLPYTRLPHPKYKGKRIPAYDMIKHSVNIHRGCFGGCAFCTISAHQGKFIVNRSEESILREIKEIAKMDDFKGYLSDLGGPSANMYMMRGKKSELCSKCARPSCIQPKVCPNLNINHQPLLDLYKKVDALPEIKKSFIGSGVRYDLLLHKTGDKECDAATERYTEELISRHVSGRLKVAPEHTNDDVLTLMRKPPFKQFHDFKRIFDRINTKNNLKQQIIPYFISSHPGSTLESMAELAAETKQLNFQLEQVQDYTLRGVSLSEGYVSCAIVLPEQLYYEILSTKAGLTIENDAQLLSLLMELAKVKQEYDKISDALTAVKATGYGVVQPSAEEMKLEKPEIIRKGSTFGVKLKAGAPSIHMVRVDLDTEISPMVGDEKQSRDLIEHLTGEDPEHLWQSNIFGKSVYDLIQEGLTAKLVRMPTEVRGKFRGTLTRIVNEGATGLICLIL
jgi:radical SAM superfamily enzyme YgiQ (UPF0313 family)